MLNDNTIEAAIKDLFDNITFTDAPAGLYDPLRYMIAIGGKRIRPRLCLTAYGLFADHLDDSILQPAAGIEIFHSFTLIHDDIMDKSPLRRGHDTVWKRWNADTAILSGDVMCIDSYKRLVNAPLKALGKVLDLFSTTAAEVCDGQQYDMEFENRTDVSMEEYMKMIGLKTAVLIACSAKMGTLIAGAPDDVCDALYRFGYDLGLAFQVADDYLDAYADLHVFGKPIGGDILNNKKSWLYLNTYAKADDATRKDFLEAMAMDSSTPEAAKAKIDAVKAIYAALDTASDATAEIHRLHERAMSHVAFLGDTAAPLKRYADNLLCRKK